LDPADYDFYTNGIHTVKAEATDPEGGSLTFKWSGDGTIVGEDINPMTWTAPDSVGIYKITVEVTDEKGSTATMTADIYVNPELELAEPPKGAEIVNIKVIDGDNGLYHKDTHYVIQVTVNDPLNEIEWYEYTANEWKLPIQSVAHCTFKSPDTAGDIDIVVGILDKDFKIIDEKMVTIYIEP